MNTPNTAAPEPQAPAPDAWDRQHVALPFKLGPFTLASARFDLLVNSHSTHAAVNAPDSLQDALQPLPFGCDGMWFYGLQVSAPLPTRFGLDGLLGYVPIQAEHHVIDLSLGEERYWAQLSANSRSQMRRKVKAFEKQSGGAIDWQCFRTPDELAAFDAEARPLSEQTYQHRLFQAGLPTHQGWLQQVQARAARGEVWAFVLRREGQAIAYLYLEASGSTLTYAYLGHRADQSPYSPGTVLFVLALNHVFRHAHCRWLDFGSGEGQHKQTLATGQLTKAQVFLLRPTWKNRALLSAHTTLGATSQLAMALVHKSGLHARLKHLLRRWSSRG